MSSTCDINCNFRERTVLPFSAPRFRRFFTSRFCLVRRSIRLERVRARIDIGCLLLVALDVTATWWSSGQAIWYKTRIRPSKSSNGSLRVSHTLRNASICLDNPPCVARTDRGKFLAKHPQQLGFFSSKLQFQSFKVRLNT